jgi:hypothetical protein
MHRPIARWPATTAILFLFLSTGCQSTVLIGLAPVGAGAATKRDLTPWMASAAPTKQFGILMEMNVAGADGSYDTWAVATNVAEQSMEVDVRACPGEAEDFRGKPVIIEGKMLERGRYNLPLLVAERIAPADAMGNELPDYRKHLALAPEADPATGERDPMMRFENAGEIITASAN